MAALDRSTGSLAVTGLAHHDNIRVLTHQGAQTHIEGHTRGHIDLGLVDAGDIFLHRILDGGYIHLPAGQVIQHHIQCSGLTASGGAGNVNDTVGVIQHGCELVVAEIIHTEMIGVIQMGRRSQNTQHRFLAEDCGQHGHTDVDIALIQLYPEMAVLGNTLLSNIQIRQNLDTGDKRRVDVPVNGHIFHNDAVNTHAHPGLIFKGLNMDIAGACLNGTLQKAV